MWDIICQQNMYRLTYKTASRPIGLDSSVVHLDENDASYLLRYCNTVNFIWSGKMKQMMARLFENMWDI